MRFQSPETPTLKDLALEDLGALWFAETGNFEQLRCVHVVVRLALHDSDAIDILEPREGKMPTARAAQDCQ